MLPSLCASAAAWSHHRHLLHLLLLLLLLPCQLLLQLLLLQCWQHVQLLLRLLLHDALAAPAVHVLSAPLAQPAAEAAMKQQKLSIQQITSSTVCMSTLLHARPHIQPGGIELTHHTSVVPGMIDTPTATTCWYLLLSTAFTTSTLRRFDAGALEPCANSPPSL
jgi:hypothetical protein